MRTKRWMSFLLCLVLCGALLAVTAASAHADGGQCGDNLYWSFNSSTGTLTITGSGDMYDYSEYPYGVPPVGFKENRTPWYSVKKQIRRVLLPDGLTTVGRDAFQNCEVLTSVELPKTVVNIGSGSFYKCSKLLSIDIPDSVGTIGVQAFSGCTGLKSVTMGNGVTKIYDEAFHGCTGLTEIIIPGSVTRIFGSAFADCTSLTSVTIPNSVNWIGTNLFGGCTALSSVTIPDSITNISEKMFTRCTGLTSVTIPNSVTSIDPLAFAGCTGLKTVRFSNAVTSIGYGAFQSCVSLMSVSIPNSVAAIGEMAFEGCKGLRSLYIGNHITCIEQWTFKECSKLSAVYLPSSVAEIKWDAFSGCKALKDVYYQGTKAQRDQMRIGDLNDELLNATWHYETDLIEKPVITSQPADTAVKSGSRATFAIKASGLFMSYQWLSRPNADAGWTLVDGAVSDAYTVVGTMDKNGWQFCCRVRNEGGEVISEAATLTVSIDPPTIKTQPKSANVKSGAKAKFTVKVKEKNVTYQWLSMAPEAADWTELSGETKGTLTVVATKANSGTQYRCRVRTAEGGEAFSNPATLTVKIQPPVIKTPPKSLAVVSGKKAKFTVKASGPKLTYTWYSRPNAEGEWTSIAGQTKKDLSIVASKANDGSQYYCHIQNADGEADTAVVTLTVTPQPPTIKTQPKDAKVKLGAKAKFKVKATGKNVTYQWYYRTSETGDWVPMEGETSATLTVTATAENIGWQFRCQARNADGFADSKPATLRQK